MALLKVMQKARSRLFVHHFITKSVQLVAVPVNRLLSIIDKKKIGEKKCESGPHPLIDILYRNTN